MKDWYRSSNPFKRIIGNILIFPHIATFELLANQCWEETLRPRTVEPYCMDRRQSQITTLRQYRLLQETEIETALAALDNQLKQRYLNVLNVLISQFLFHRKTTGFYARYYDAFFVGDFIQLLHKTRNWSDIDIAEDTAKAFHRKIVALPEHAKFIAHLCAKLPIWEKFIRRRPNITDGENITKHLIELCLEDLSQIPPAGKQSKINGHDDETRRKGLDNIRLLAELINNKLVTRKSIQDLMMMLIDRVNDQDYLALEQVCLLLKIVLKNLENSIADTSTRPAIFSAIIGPDVILALQCMLPKMLSNRELSSSLKREVKKTFQLLYRFNIRIHIRNF